ncbi:MAG: T9SS type A sorting domain-containing protein [Marinirhabdus sp.]|nr:T9SS type A sorting domain-containing protein [Marinirhabdus sp.]
MLKKLSLTTLLLGAFVAQAQFTVETHDGDPILDGETVMMGAASPSLDFYVNNTNPTDPINVKIEFVSATNADGSNLEICFFDCFTGVTVGGEYPDPPVTGVTIQPGQNQGSDGDHFKQIDDGSGDVLSYVFRFFQVDENGDEIGEDLTFTFDYDPDFLSVGENNSVNASVVSTMVTNNVEVTSNEPLTFTMYDIQGRIVNQTSLEAGVSRVSVADLAAQTYLVVLSNNRGASQTTKVIVR